MFAWLIKALSFAEFYRTDVESGVINLGIPLVVGINLDLAKENVALPLVEKKLPHEILQILPTHTGELNAHVVLGMLLEGFGGFREKGGLAGAERISS